MKIKSLIKEILFKLKLQISIAVKKDDVIKFIKRFNDKYIFEDLLRIGGQSDGGYLLPTKLKKVTHCFSPGVDTKIEFEKELSSKYNIKSFLADASIEKLPEENDNFKFIRKFLSNNTNDENITLRDWMSNCLDGTEGEILLQMDIEGSEYDVLTFESEKILERFSIIIIEFHFLDKIFDRYFLKMISSIFEKLYINFSICHVHPNNCCGIAKLHGIEIPRVIEVTFIRNDMVNKNNNRIVLPHPLDIKNINHKKNIIMPEIWWKKDYL